MNNDKQGKKRSLILAGGGIKVAFQAGVLQVWLDEAGLTFDHVDAASGGLFNLAMLCQGMTGLEMANNWRNLDPRAGINFNASAFHQLLYAESLFTLDNYRNHVFPSWGLDWDKIRTSPIKATFNVFNFSRKEIKVIEPAEMSEDLLVAGLSLTMWFPPVRIGGETYIDSVFMTDANIEEAIRRGADEVWVIWTVSEKDEWHNGFVANYFQIIETSADGHYRAICKRIEANNAAIQAGTSGEFGRRIEIKELKADIALHYLIDFSQDRLAEAVNLGVVRAREWCEQNNIPLAPYPGEFPTEIHDAETTISFTEEMTGFFTVGEMDYAKGYKEGREQGNSVVFNLSMVINNVHRFVTWPSHDTDDMVGWVDCPSLGGKRPLDKGIFNLIVDQADPSVKKMFYRLFFRDHMDRPYTLSGFKLIKDDPGFDLWSDTSTLYTRIFRGTVTAEQEAALEQDRAGLAQAVLGTGIIILPLINFLHQLTTFRTTGPTVGDRASALTRFGKMFLGKLWDVYAREVLTSTPL
jgi:predicted patatin/cPLA2 family phospholipase